VLLAELAEHAPCYLLEVLVVVVLIQCIVLDTQLGDARSSPRQAPS
jgi:hypothetical protein